MKHKEAVRRMAQWLRNSRGHSVVFAEFVASIDEHPDVIGWKYGESTLIECKVSRADFLADKDKTFRCVEELGMGNLRYFAAPKGLLRMEDMPDGWGLLDICEHHVRQIKPAEQKQANKAHEVMMLTSAIRRLEISTAVFVRHEEPDAMTTNADSKAEDKP